MIVRVCPECSQLDIEKIQQALGENNVEVACIAYCGESHKAYINDELYDVTSADEVIEIAKKK